MSTESGSERPSGQVRVWDLPVRICHWGFVLLLPVLWWTAENSEMRWHMRAGTLLLALVIFRILWGFAGSSTARFASFVRGPLAVLGYLRTIGKGGDKAPGHNPAGGWSAVVLILLLAAQAFSGLFAGDPFDGATGPLNEALGIRFSAQMTDWHEWAFNLILGFVALHLVAIATYSLVLRDRLVPPMITGKREGGAIVGEMQPVPAWRAVLCAVLAGGAALWVYNGAPGL